MHGFILIVGGSWTQQEVVDSGDLLLSVVKLLLTSHHTSTVWFEDPMLLQPN